MPAYSKDRPCLSQLHTDRYKGIASSPQKMPLFQSVPHRIDDVRTIGHEHLIGDLSAIIYILLQFIKLTSLKLFRIFISYNLQNYNAKNLLDYLFNSII